MPPTGEFTVTAVQNDHGAMTVCEDARNATYHIVEYGDSEVESRAADLAPGSRCEAELSRAGRRGNVWRAESLEQVTPNNGS